MFEHYTRPRPAARGRHALAGLFSLAVHGCLGGGFGALILMGREAVQEVELERVVPLTLVEVRAPASAPAPRPAAPAGPPRRPRRPPSAPAPAVKPAGAEPPARPALEPALEPHQGAVADLGGGDGPPQAPLGPGGGGGTGGPGACIGEACATKGGAGAGLLARPLEVLHREIPVYPRAARALEIDETRCLVTFSVDAGGRPLRVGVEGCPEVFHPELQRAAKAWRFEPARDADGTRIPASFKMTFTFRLRG